MNGIKRVRIAAFGLGVMLVAFNAVYFGVTGFATEVDTKPRGNSPALDNGTMVAEQSKSSSGRYEKTDYKVGGFPATAFDYAKMVEPELGVPPKIDLGAGVEIPLYVDGVQARGSLGNSCDNPSRLGKGCISGSVLQRYEGRTADGEPLPDVVWVSFGRNSSFAYNGSIHVLGSVQMIGYHRETGATAFFESSDAIDPWASIDPETERLLGVMPWIDEPEEFNRAFRTPGTIQCVECHQNDPFIHNDFIDAAKIPGTNETVVPEIADRSRIMEFDLPYSVIGGENWDMRTIHIEGNGCVKCHRVGMGTAKLFMRYGWDPNEHMPPNDPSSLSEDFQELLDCWENRPENTPGCDWIIPPAGDSLGRVVGDDYPYKAAFNTPGREALSQPGNTKGGKSFKKSGKSKGANSSKDMSREELIEAMKAKGMTEEEIAEFMESLGEAKKAKGK